MTIDKLVPFLAFLANQPLLLMSVFAKIAFTSLPTYLFLAASLILCLSLQWLKIARTNLPVDWNNQTILITGASFGLGKNLVEYLLKNKPAVKIVALDIRAIDVSHPQLTFFQCDISDLGQIEKIVKEVTETVGSF